jgi:serine/threonine protein kinase
MIGQKLNNRYQINARLGKGAMGIVYRATDTANGQDVALKIISGELAVDPAMLERFKREGEALRHLKHRNIVGFSDAFQHDEQSIIVMEYVDGGSLFDLIKKGPLPIEHAVQIALDVCDALISSHRLKIIHRDIKPENILIDNEGTPKLADFGVARLSEGTRMTRSGVQVGTPYYMSPEAWEGKPLDAQADIWSLGVVLFEMLSGQVPFGGDTPVAVMTKVSTTPPPDLKKLRADVPYGLVRIISKMLARDKRRRYETMREVAVDLEREQKALAPHAKNPRVHIYEQMAARIATVKQSSNTIILNSKSTLTKLASRLRAAILKIPLNFRIAGITGLAILVLAAVLYPSLQARLTPRTSSPGSLSPPIAAPDNGLVVFSTSPSEGEIKFYLYDVATGNFSIIDVGDGTNWDPVLSQAGTLYFTSNRDGRAEIYSRRLENGEWKIERVTHTPGQFESWGPAPGLDGNLYFTSDREDNKAEIWRRRLENGQWKYERFTHTPGQFESWGAAPSIGGNLYFTSNRDGKAEIYRVLGDETPKRITHTDGNFQSWGAAPGAENLYFTSNRENNKAEIYQTLINDVSGEPNRFTHTPGEFESWGPIFYGLNVYFSSNRSGRNEVYLLMNQNSLNNILDIESWTNYSDSTNLDERSPIYSLP